MMDICFEKAKEVLKGNDTKRGVMAGREYYRDVWGRDGMITSLGMSCSGDPDLLESSRKTIDSISAYQKFTGQLPNKVSPGGKELCFGEGGCVDTSLWYPIAVLHYYLATKDRKFLESHADRIEKAVFWASCLDLNGDCLLETHDGSDWMDLLLRSGRILYDNTLYYASLKALDRINGILKKKRKHGKLASMVKRNINIFFWPEESVREKVVREYGHTGLEKDFETALAGGENNHYLADLGFRKYDPRLDVFANLLAILFDIADRKRTNLILEEIIEKGADQPFPVKVLTPPIQKGDRFWYFYFRWSVYPHLMQPGHYHNGGIWPFVGGFYVAALKKSGRDCSDALERLAESNRRGRQNDFEFNEWLNWNGTPLGSAHQSWSAGMFIYAYQYSKGKAPDII